MLPGPIFNIELLTSSRRTRFYWIRVVYASLLLLTMWSEYPGTFGRAQTLSIHEVARFAFGFFWTFAWLQMGLVLMVGPALVVPTISVERERRTIEYLLATDLTNAEIVLGKLLARVLHLTYAVLVGLPVLALAGLMGGIDLRLLLAVFVITTSTMLAVAALAIVVSVQAVRVRDAIVQVYVFLLALLAVPPLLRQLLMPSGYYQWIAPLNDYLNDGNPLVLLTRIAMGRWGGAAWSDTGQLVLYQGVFAACCTAFAMWRLRRVVVKSASGKRGKAARSRRPITDQPVLWKEQGDNRLGSYGWAGRIALGLLLAILSGLLVYFFYDELFEDHSQNTIHLHLFDLAAEQILLYIFCGGLLLLGARAAGSITGERERDTWISLLSTPLSARDIMYGKVRGSLRLARGIFWYWGFVTVLRAIVAPWTLLSAPFSLGTAALLTVFCSTLGTYISLVSRSTARALGTTMALLVFLGGGYLFCCFPVMFLGDPARNLIFAPCGPFLLGVSLNLGAPQRFNYDGQRFDYSAGELPAYFLGIALYAGATAILYNRGLVFFDHFNGRLEAVGEDAANWPDEPVAAGTESATPASEPAPAMPQPVAALPEPPSGPSDGETQP